MSVTLQQRIWHGLHALMFGAALGILAKRLDNTPIIGQIGTYLGIWVLLATLIAVYSRSPVAAAAHVFLFFAGMLVSYYSYSMILFGFFPKRYFFAWGSIALFSPVCAYVVWHARGQGWVSAFIASLPLSLLLVEGYSFFYTHSIPQAFDILATLALFMVLAKNTAQKPRVLISTGIMFSLFNTLNIIPRIFGGL